MNKVILIGGSPTAGKSYTARKLAEELKLPWISTDLIREQMRWIVKKEEYTELFHHSDDSPDRAVEFLTHNTAEQIVEHQNRESGDVWRGVVGIVEGDYVWGDFIVEGVAIIPELVASQKWKTRTDIKTLFLVDEDEDRVRNTIFTRGLWGEASKYPDSVKEKEIEWVFAFNKYIKEEAARYNFPVISVDRQNYIEEVKKLL